MTIWYGLSELENSVPVAYFKRKYIAQKFKTDNSLKVNLGEVENPSHLEHILKKEGKIIASFEFEPHAQQYNIKYLNNKGTVSSKINTPIQ